MVEATLSIPYPISWLYLEVDELWAGNDSIVTGGMGKIPSLAFGLYISLTASWCGLSAWGPIVWRTGAFWFSELF